MLARRLGLTMLVLCTGTALIMAFASILITRQAIDPLARALQHRQVALLVSRLTNVTDKLREETLTVLDSTPALALAQASLRGQPLDEGDKRQALRVMRAHLQQRSDYLQVRILGKEGRELLRVERSTEAGDPVITPDAVLQHKGNRPYFLNTIQLKAGETLVTEVELNREWGAVQLPRVPVVRCGTPIVDEDGSVIGAVIINLDLRPAFAELRGRRDDDVRVFLANERGDFLVHPQPDFEFRAELGMEPLVARELPDLAGKLVGSEEVVSNTVDPRLGPVTRMARAMNLASGPGVWLISEQRRLGEIALGPIYLATLLVILASAVMVALVAGVFASRLTEPIKALTEAARLYPDGSRFDVGGPGELGVLTQALSAMDRGIRERMATVVVQEQRYRELFEVSPSALIKVDKHHRIILMNRQAEVLFGYSRHELLNQPLTVLLPPHARERHQAYVDTFLENPEARAMGAGRDLAAVRKNGQHVAVEIGLVPMGGPEGTRTLASIVDITQRKRQESDIRRSNEQLEQFAYIASHDLQEPLRMVASYTELLARKYQGKLDDQADRYIGFAVEGARRLKELVTDLLAYSRIGSQARPLSPVDPNAVVERVLRSLQALLEGHQGEVRVHGTLPWVMADETQLGQLLQNLITNAVKFRSEAPPRIEISASTRAGMVHFKVKDNGIGFDNEYKERIFQMFQRLHERGAFSGSGMGLAIVKSIVDRHQGKVWADSSPGAGSTFHFTMAVTNSPATSD